MPFRKQSPNLPGNNCLLPKLLFFLRHMKPLGFRVSSDLYSDNFYALSEVNAEALVDEAGDVVFKGK